VGIGLLVLIALAVRYARRRYPHMWDEAPANETSSRLEEH
jgi:CBS-domain-containing membrane protein